jgi:hypothetical protein
MISSPPIDRFLQSALEAVCARIDHAVHTTRAASVAWREDLRAAAREAESAAHLCESMIDDAPWRNVDRIRLQFADATLMAVAAELRYCCATPSASAAGESERVLDALAHFHP